MYQKLLEQALDVHKKGDFPKAIYMYNQLLNRDPNNESVLFLLGDAYLRSDFNGMAVNLLRTVVAINPKNSNAWCNLGIGYRKEEFRDRAKEAWSKALELSGDTPEVCHNMAGLYADSGKPYEAIKWCERAIKQGAGPEVYWQMSLAQLTIGDWETGLKNYEKRQILESWDSRSNIKIPLWDGKETDHLYIHGEQGVGDEIMFASCINEALTKAKKVTIEVNEKVQNIIKQTWPQCDVVTKETVGDYTAKIPIGSLFYLFHPKGDFKAEAFLKPDQERVKYYRSELEKLGPPPYVAVTWIGGTKQTRVVNRSLAIDDLKPLLSKFTCVSAQYSNGNPFIEEDIKKAGLTKINEESSGLDLAEQAALFKACDYVVTVQQTAVHVAGAVGTRTFAMLPSNPQWRYGIEGEKMPWYDSVTLLRKKEDETWSSVVAKTIRRIEAVQYVD